MSRDAVPGQSAPEEDGRTKNNRSPYAAVVPATLYEMCRRKMTTTIDL